MVMQEEHKSLYWFGQTTPYVQCEDRVSYYLVPEVLVVGVTSEPRERVRGRQCDVGMSACSVSKSDYVMMVLLCCVCLASLL
jgi:hypothetical protein